MIAATELNIGTFKRSISSNCFNPSPTNLTKVAPKTSPKTELAANMIASMKKIIFPRSDLVIPKML